MLENPDAEPDKAPWEGTPLPPSTIFKKHRSDS